jgi:hypothetical protein
MSPFLCKSESRLIACHQTNHHQPSWNTFAVKYLSGLSLIKRAMRCLWVGFCKGQFFISYFCFRDKRQRGTSLRWGDSSEYSGGIIDPSLSRWFLRSPRVACPRVMRGCYPCGIFRWGLWLFAVVLAPFFQLRPRRWIYWEWLWTCSSVASRLKSQDSRIFIFFRAWLLNFRVVLFEESEVFDWCWRLLVLPISPDRAMSVDFFGTGCRVSPGYTLEVSRAVPVYRLFDNRPKALSHFVLSIFFP